MIYRLERYKKAPLTIIMQDRATNVKLYPNTRVKVGVDCEMPMQRPITGLSEGQQEEFEKLLFLNKGDLSRTSNYWKGWGIFVDDKGAILNDEFPEQALAIHVIGSRSDVAKSSAEATKLSNINWLLSSGESEAEAKTEKRDYLKKSMILLDELSPQQMEEVLILDSQLPSTMSPKVIKDKVGDMAETNPKKFIALVNNPDKKEILLIQELVNSHILSRFNKQYLDQNGKVIAFSQEDMVNFINNPSNNQIVAGFKKQLSIFKKESK